MKIFVILPWRQAVTVRDLSFTASLEKLHADLELLCGLPGDTFSLWLGNRQLSVNVAVSSNGDSDGSMSPVSTTLGQLLREGSTVNMRLHGQYNDLLRFIWPQSEDPSWRSQWNDGDVVSGHKEKEEEDNYFLFAAAFLMSFRGLTPLLISAFERYARVIQVTRTPHGRSVLHAAAASEQYGLLDELIKRLHDDSLLQTVDSQGKTPVDVAREQGARLSERVMKKHLRRRRRERLKEAVSESDVISARCDNVRSNGIDAKMTSPLSQLSKAYRPIVEPDTGAVTSSPSLGLLNVRSVRGLSSSMQSRPSLYASPLPGDVSSKTSSLYPARSAVQSRRATTGQGSRVRDQSHIHGSQHQGHQGHDRCNRLPPFIVFQTVDPAEMRMETVNVVPLNTLTYEQRKAYYNGHGNDALRAKYGSPDGSEEYMALAGGQDEGYLTETPSNTRYSSAPTRCRTRGSLAYPAAKVTPATSYRIQSAKYYKTKYHHMAEEDTTLPKPRPETAGSRFRTWKTWLLEKYEQEGKSNNSKAKGSSEEAKAAFDQWLARKRSEGAFDKSDSEDEYMNSDEEREDFLANYEAYAKWTQRKKDTAAAELSANHKRRLATFEYGNTDPIAVKKSDPATYLRSYQTWMDNKRDYLEWKKEQSTKKRSPLSSKEVDSLRLNLLLNGITFHEWLGLKDCENEAASHK